MTSRDFAFWLQGMFELTDPKQLDATQTEAIKRHLALVFKHEIVPATQAAPPPTPQQLGIRSLDATSGVSYGSVSTCGIAGTMIC